MKKTYICDSCKNPFQAKVADRKRGWARCCSKSCAAKKREKKTGAFKEYLKLSQEIQGDEYCDDGDDGDDMYWSGKDGD